MCVHRLEQLVTLFLHKNHLSYLPQCLTNIHTLKMVVVSGDKLNCIPTRLCSNPAIKYASTHRRVCTNRNISAATNEENTHFIQISGVKCAP